MRKASLQKGLHHAILHPIKYSIEPFNNALFMHDHTNKDACAFLLHAKNEDNITWKCQKTYNELSYMQYEFNELRMRSTFPAFKTEKRLLIEIAAWLNELAEACTASIANYQILLLCTDFPDDSINARKGSLSSNHAHHSHSGHSLSSLPTQSLTIHTRIGPRRVIKSGYLLKLDGNRSGQHWRRMFVVLSDNLLFFDHEAASESGTAPKAICSLDAYTVLKAAPPNEAFEFTILSAKYSASVTLRAVSQDELECWYQLLALFPDCV